MWSIQKETGWSDHCIMWEVSLPSLRAKLADALRYKSGEKVKEITDFDDIEL